MLQELNPQSDQEERVPLKLPISDDVRNGFYMLSSYLVRNGGKELSEGFVDYMNAPKNREDFVQAFRFLKNEGRERVEGLGSIVNDKATEEDIFLAVLASFAVHYMTRGHVSWTKMLAIAVQESGFQGKVDNGGGSGTFQITLASSVTEFEKPRHLARANVKLHSWKAPLVEIKRHVGKEENFRYNVVANGLAAFETYLSKSVQVGSDDFKRIMVAYNGDIPGHDAHGYARNVARLYNGLNKIMAPEDIFAMMDEPRRLPKKKEGG
jgi:hypothetical protein